MSNVILSDKDKRVLDISNLMEHPGFKFVENFFEDRIKYETSKIERILKNRVSDLTLEFLNETITRKKILEEIKSSLKDSLEEYTKLDESDFTDLSGAKY
mgnify:CR=1 FL=1